MNVRRLALSFVPLVDAAPLIAAHEMGFGREEGLELDLRAAPSWSAARDMLAFGQVEAAHMLSPVPVAMALGLGGVASPISALMVLSLNGTVIGVSNALAARLKAHGTTFDDAAGTGRALAALGGGPLRIGVPFPFSMHAELLYYWLSASGLPAPQNVEIHTVPPPMMADAMAAGEIDAFCVGEPWGSHAVEIGAASLLLTGRAIWSAAPEKVLAVRSDWAEENPGLTGRLMRAIWRGCRWLSESGVETTAAELLAQDKYLGVAPEIIDRALRGRFVISPSGEVRPAPGFMSFYEGAANFPWRSQAAWIGHQMAARLGLDREASVRAACEVFRTDLYRLHMRDSGATLPGASSKIEGGCAPGTAAASETGRLFLPENRFFDSRVFDPAGFD